MVRVPIPARIGVVVSILPVVDAVLTSTSDLLKVDVGQIVNIDASDSADDWNQIAENGYVWNTALADCSTSTSGSSVDLCWTTESRTVEVTIDSIDGRSATSSVQITVVDRPTPLRRFLYLASLTVEWASRSPFQHDPLTMGSCKRGMVCGRTFRAEYQWFRF